MKQTTVLMITLIVIGVFIPHAYAHHSGMESSVDIQIEYSQSVVFTHHEYSLQLQTCDTAYVTCTFRTVIPYEDISITIYKEIDDYSKYSDVELRSNPEPETIFEEVERFEFVTSKGGQLGVAVIMDGRYDSDHFYTVVISAEDDTETERFWLMNRTAGSDKSPLPIPPIGGLP